MRRSDIAQFMQDVVGFAKVIASSVGASGSPQLKIQATDDDQSADTCEWWGHPAISCKPPAGGEALFIDLGGERVVLGVKERRWQVSVADGECVVRALGSASPAYIKLKPDGTAEVHAERVDLGGEALATFLARADKVDTELAAIADTFASFVPGTGGASFSVPYVDPPPSVAASKVRGT